MSSLPKLNTPTYFLVIPSTKKRIKYRPFFVKEEKIMMLVKESKNQDEILNIMKDIISACTYGKLDPNTLAMFDIEYIFLQLRSKSIGEIVELNMKCVNEIELPKADDHPAGVDAKKKVCGGIIPFSIDVSKIKVKFPKNHTNVVVLSDDIGITFKYPSLNTMITDENDNEKDEIELIVDLIDNIFDGDNVFDAKDVKREEFVEFIENITNKQFSIIREKFFETIPHLSHTVKYKCEKCGYEDTYNFRGISDFF